MHVAPRVAVEAPRINLRHIAAQGDWAALPYGAVQAAVRLAAARVVTLGRTGEAGAAALKGERLEAAGWVVVVVEVSVWGVPGVRVLSFDRVVVVVDGGVAF